MNLRNLLQEKGDSKNIPSRACAVAFAFQGRCPESRTDVCPPRTSRLKCSTTTLPFYPDVGHRATQIKGQTQHRHQIQQQQQKLILQEYHTMVHSGAYLSHYLLRPPPLESLLLLLSSSSSSPSLSPSSSAAATTTTTADKRLLFSSRRRRRCQHRRHTRSIRRPVEGKGRKCKVPQPQLLSSSQDRRWPRLDGC